MRDSDFKLCSFPMTPERHSVGFVRRAQQATGAWSTLVCSRRHMERDCCGAPDQLQMTSALLGVRWRSSCNLCVLGISILRSWEPKWSLVWSKSR